MYPKNFHIEYTDIEYPHALLNTLEPLEYLIIHFQA